MSGANVIRQSKVGFDEFGQNIVSDEVYMQFLVSFMRDGSLRKLKGAPLAAFIAIGLHEAEILHGKSSPFTLFNIMAVTGYSKPIMIAALDYLVNERFATELNERGANREKQYRISAYMWFGASRKPKIKGKESLPLRSKKFFPHDDDDLVQEDSTPHHHHDCAKIFSDAGLQGKNLAILAEKVEIENARAWAEWIKSEPSGVKNPIAYAWACLRDDPQAVPPKTKSKSARWYDDCNEFVNR